MEGLNYHTLSLILHRLKLPEIIGKTMISTTDKNVKKAAALALISLVYGLLPETKILSYNIEELKGILNKFLYENSAKSNKFSKFKSGHKFNCF